MNIYRIIDNDITFLESRTLNALYYSAFLTISSNGSGELVTPVAYAHAKTKNIELATHSLGYYYPYEGPNKTQFFKLDKSLVSSSAIDSNILWFISPNPPSNPDKKYSSEEELANDGYIKITTDSGYTEIVENEGKLKYGATLDITDIEDHSALKQVSCFFYDSAKKTYNLALSWPIDSATVYDEEPNILVIRAYFYASLLHDRSKTVYDNETMRPDYKVRNEAGTTENSPKCESK